MVPYGTIQSEILRFVHSEKSMDLRALADVSACKALLPSATRASPPRAAKFTAAASIASQLGRNLDILLPYTRREKKCS